jgi:hypothetical protein
LAGCRCHPLDRQLRVIPEGASQDRVSMLVLDLALSSNLDRSHLSLRRLTLLSRTRYPLAADLEPGDPDLAVAWILLTCSVIS